MSPVNDPTAIGGAAWCQRVERRLGAVEGKVQRLEANRRSRPEWSEDEITGVDSTEALGQAARVWRERALRAEKKDDGADLLLQQQLTRQTKLVRLLIGALIAAVVGGGGAVAAVRADEPDTPAQR